ncbi:hypothetical protein HDE_03509 [Halotydeus destructor]|nr:hypothetical protein HDE_03509 [Halotydeus destructor]
MKSIAEYFIFIAALLGCLLQTGFVSLEYFGYHTLSRVTIQKSTIFSPPTLIVCFQIDKMVDKKIENGNFTVKYVLEKSFKIEEIFHQCKIRDPVTYRMLHHSKECNSDYSVLKFVKQRYLCYSFALDKKYQYEAYRITNGYYAPRAHTPILNQSFAYKVDHMCFYTLDHSLGHFYGQSQNYWEQENENSSANFMVLSYRKYEAQTLQAPYDSECTNYTAKGFESQGHCYEHCVSTETISKYDVVPFSVATYEPVDKLYFSEKQFKENDTLLMGALDIEDQCRMKCIRSNCLEITYVPFVVNTSPTDKIHFDFHVTSEPEVNTILVAKFEAMDYAVYVLSCISFWFGFSPLGFMIDARKRMTKIRPRSRPVFGAPRVRHFYST